MADVYNPTRPSLRNANDLATQYGLTYDPAVLQSKFDTATKAQYDALRNEYQSTENQFYNSMYNNQQTALDTIRKSNAQAVATGASRGLQAANELSATLGLQQQTTEGATQLANDRNLLMDQEQQAYAQNVVNALETANSVGLSLGNLNANLYASDTQFDVGQMDYYARLQAAQKEYEGLLAQAEANKYSADRNLEGVKYTANSYNSSSGGYSSGGYSAGSTTTAGTGTSTEGTTFASNTGGGVASYKTKADKIAFMVANGMDVKTATKLSEYGDTSAGWIDTVLSGTASGFTPEQAIKWANDKIIAQHSTGQGSTVPKGTPTTALQDWKTYSNSEEFRKATGDNNSAFYTTKPKSSSSAPAPKYKTTPHSERL